MTTEVPKKVVEKIRKLLALADPRGGATEAEAALAGERAREMMAEHGLTTATVEASGGQGEARADERATGLAAEYWQPPLMEALAETCFVFVERLYSVDKARRTLGEGYRLIGRESGVATCRVMHEYLCATVRRLTKEARPEVPKWFRRGMSERLCERIQLRHREEMRKQAEAAEQRRQAAPPDSRALVVSLTSYARRETDLNNDLRRGVPPGTTEREREERETALAERMKKRSREKAALMAEGVPENIADYMTYGYTREEAEKLCAPITAPALSEKERAKKEREQERYERRWRKETAKRFSPDWTAGRAHAESVSLDRQIDKQEEQRRLK